MSGGVHEGCCDRCGSAFRFDLVHSGLTAAAYVYCDDCGRTGLVTAPGREGPRSGALEAEAVGRLSPCTCGGAYRVGASPRCPECAERLCPTFAAGYIETAIHRVAAGWRWQRNWTGLYFVAIEGRVDHPVPDTAHDGGC